MGVPGSTKKEAMMRQTFFLAAACAALAVLPLQGREIFVTHRRAVWATARRRHPFGRLRRLPTGDMVTTADGIYREWVNPPRGGTAEGKRIVYRAAEGTHPVLTGGEPLTGWEEIGGGI